MDRAKIVKELRAKAREHRAVAGRLEHAAAALKEKRPTRRAARRPTAEEMEAAFNKARRRA